MHPEVTGKTLINKIDSIKELIAHIQKKGFETESSIRRLGPTLNLTEDPGSPELDRGDDQYNTTQQASLCSDLDVIIKELKRLNTVSGNNLTMLNELI